MAVEQVTLWFRVVVWVQNVVPWKRFIPGLNKLRVTVRDVPTKNMRDKNGAVTFAMLQLWVANTSSDDAEQVMAVVQWKRHGGGTLTHHNTPGLWLIKLGSEMASYRGVDEQVSLPSNGEEQHLGLLAKAPGDRNAFIIAPGSYHQGQFPNYQHPSFAVTPGDYDVDVVFTARGRKEATVRLEVHQPGLGGDPTGKQR
jgi:hypothetical protein